MLITKESHQQPQRTQSGFTIGQTVQVVDLNRVGRIVGMQGGMWLVSLTEGDTPISRPAGSLMPRQTLMG